MHIITGSPTEEEAAAAVAAITLLLAEESAQSGAEVGALPARWRDSMRLIAQGLPPVRVPVAPRWSTIERLRRAGRGGMGIVGM
ncbi:acyl-CoA carboxylase epsilon subunit [Chloroflexus sp.]|uniref:acyl-CoA carboxylase epsilon subunit n=1 Tax=Chloroflexus sp. TaxID=1904827 RepID=UPI0026265496|nr:acyl-CoA carboxylase epsilon subunit [uncultured Chloroflexus sp.]